jgi:DNA modification methylase
VDPRTSTINQSLRGNTDYGVTRTPVQKNIKEKDLLMIPNRVAIALQEAGWYIRSEIIWHKPNPMPESVTDRPTSCHEKIWLITKNKKYYYDY